MKLKLPKKVNPGFIATILLVAVVLFEIYLGYFYLFQQLNPEAKEAGSKNIIRLNRADLKQINQDLDNLIIFTPKEPGLANPNPFKYSK